MKVSGTQKREPVTHLPRVDTAQLSACCDENAGIAYVTYRGILTPLTAIQVYKWIAAVAQASGVESLRGIIHDFRDVTHFQDQTLRTIRIERQKLSARLDMSRIAEALLVKNALQEQIVRITLKGVSQYQQKCMVFSEEEAVAFIGRRDGGCPGPDDSTPAGV